MYVCLSLFFICVSVDLSLCLFLCLSVSLSVSLSSSLLVYMFVCLFVDLYICLVCLLICLSSVCLPNWLLSVCPFKSITIWSVYLQSFCLSFQFQFIYLIVSVCLPACMSVGHAPICAWHMYIHECTYSTYMSL